MTSFLRFPLVLCVLAIAACVVDLPQGDSPPGQEAADDFEGDPRSTFRGREVVGYYVNWDLPLSQVSLERHARHIDVVSPFWYRIEDSGQISHAFGGPRADALEAARARGVKVIALFNNANHGHRMFTDPQARQRAIEEVMTAVRVRGYDGVNIDFEMIPNWTRDSLTTFVRELGARLRAEGKSLIVSVFPVVDVPAELTGAYDYAALHPHIDRLQLMTYDRHWSGGRPGPIAPIGWVEENIRYALRQGVPPAKILVGIAAYGYDWPQSGAQGSAVGERQALSIAAERGATIQWDEVAQVPFFHYWQGPLMRTIYFESSYSAAFKFRLVERYGLRGIAIWRLGTETDRFWQIVESTLWR